MNEQKNTIIVVAYPIRSAGNDPKLFFFFFFFGGGGGGVVFHHQGSTFLQWVNMGVMICLGQGGLRSLSASSLLSLIVNHLLTMICYNARVTLPFFKNLFYGKPSLSFTPYFIVILTL